MLRWHRFAGSPPEVLALHGFLGSGEDFEALHANLPLSLSAPDLHGADAASIGELAELVAGPSIVCGYSMGARVALELALGRPLDALILIGATAGIADPSERAARREADEPGRSCSSRRVSMRSSRGGRRSPSSRATPRFPSRGDLASGIGGVAPIRRRSRPRSGGGAPAR
jgi:pimeloyl-ACP methyl ester carboxylesterase